MFVNLWGCCINVPVVSCAFRKHTWITCVFFLLMGCIQTLRSTLFQSAQYLLLLKCYLVVEEGPFVVDKLDLNSHNSWTKTILPESSSAGILVWLSTWSSYPGRFLTRRSDLFCEWDDLGNTAYCLPAFAWLFFHVFLCTKHSGILLSQAVKTILLSGEDYLFAKGLVLVDLLGEKSRILQDFFQVQVDPFSMTSVIFSA